MAVSSWPSEVTQECLQNLVSKGYMTTVEFATSLVPAGSVSPTSVEGFIVVCATFFEQGFGFCRIDCSALCSGLMAWNCIT
jgi:hypothetical protein